MILTDAIERYGNKPLLLQQLAETIAEIVSRDDGAVSYQLGAFAPDQPCYIEVSFEHVLLGSVMIRSALPDFVVDRGIIMVLAAGADDRESL